MKNDKTIIAWDLAYKDSWLKKLWLRITHFYRCSVLSEETCIFVYKKGKVIEYRKLCWICGKPTKETNHAAE